MILNIVGLKKAAYCKKLRFLIVTGYAICKKVQLYSKKCIMNYLINKIF